MTRGMVAAIACLSLVTLVSARQAPERPWQPPLGIPRPAFGIVQTAPAAPSPWTGEVPGFYYVNAAAQSATDAGNTYGTPARPRASIPRSLPAGSVVELHGVYDRSHTSPNIIVAEGTADRPVFIRGAGPGERPEIVQGWQVSGSYVVLEHLQFRARDAVTTGGLVFRAPVDHAVLRHSELSGNLDAGGVGVESWDGRSIASQTVIWDNKIHDNGNVRADFDQDVHGIHVSARVEHLWVVDNQMWGNSGDGIQISARYRRDQATTHHIYVGRNVSHHNKQNGFWTKQAEDVIFSQNVSYGNRPSNSSPGGGFGYQYAPDYVWFLFNEAYDSDFGLSGASDASLGTGTEVFVIGNLFHDIHDSDGDFNPRTGWQNCAISMPGGTNRYVVNNTVYDVDSGICSPAVGGKMEIHNNIVYGVREDGQHIFLEMGRLAAASHATGNVFGPGYRAMTAGKQWESDDRAVHNDGRNSVVRQLGFLQGPPNPYDLGPSAPAIDVGVDDPGGVYARFEERYGIDIRRDFLGRPRPARRAYDAGAFEVQESPGRR